MDEEVPGHVDSRPLCEERLDLGIVEAPGLGTPGA